MKVLLDNDCCGNLLIYIGERMIMVRGFWHKCPWCHGAISDPYDEPCGVCGDEPDMTPWRYWYWRARLRWYDVTEPLYVWWHEHHDASEDDD